MSRKKKQRDAEAIPDEVLAEGSGPVGAPTTVEELAEAVEELEARVDVVLPSIEPSASSEPSAEPAMAEAAAVVDEEEAIAAAECEPTEVEAESTECEPIEGGAAVLPTSAVTLDDLRLKHLVEAIVFAADKPVTLQRLRQLTRISDAQRLEHALEELDRDYADRGIALQRVSGGYQFRTNTTYSAWVQQLVAGRPVRLSRAQLETLAIVAYRQPITRPEIDEIRGVDSSATLRLLLDRSLIRVLGKREEVGRPMLYGTTAEFLDFFSLQDLRELPTLREYSELTAESRQVMSDRLGVGLESEAESVPSLEPVADPEVAAAGDEPMVDVVAEAPVSDDAPIEE